MNNSSRIALAVVATGCLAAVALLSVLRSDTARRTQRQRVRTAAIQRWDDEGGNIPEVSISSGEQGRTAWSDGSGN